MNENKSKEIIHTAFQREISKRTNAVGRTRGTSLRLSHWVVRRRCWGENSPLTHSSLAQTPTDSLALRGIFEVPAKHSLAPTPLRLGRPPRDVLRMRPGEGVFPELPCPRTLRVLLLHFILICVSVTSPLKGHRRPLHLTLLPTPTLARPDFASSHVSLSDVVLFFCLLLFFCIVSLSHVQAYACPE